MKKIALIERSLHKVYYGIYDILKKDFDVDIISSDLKADTILEEVGSHKSSTIFVHYKGLFSHLIKTKPDYVCVRTYYRGYSLIALLYSIIFFKKFIIMEEQNQHIKGWWKNAAFQILFLPIKPIINMKVHKIICVTDLSYKFMQEHGFEKCVCIPIPINSKEVKVDSTGKRINIICVARLTKHKGIHILLKAISTLTETKRINKAMIRATIIGKGSEDLNLKLMAENLDINDIVEFKGWVDNNQLDKIYRQHNLFVLPSLEEPIGMTLFEAQSNGVLSIVSDRVGGSNPGSIEFTSENHRLLAESIYFLSDEVRRKKIADAAYVAFRKYTNPERIRKLYLKEI